MATVSRGEITITNVDDGKPSYTHPAYAWSADGTDRFTTTYPNENLINAAIIIEKNYIGSVGDLVASSNNFATDFIQVSPGDIFASTQPFEGAGYGRLAEYDVEKNYIRRQLLQRTSSGSSELQFAPVGATTAYIRWSPDSSGGTYKTGYKLQKGAKPVIYTPAPSDDFANAYPTFAGTYTDYEPTASTDPADYTWQRILGQGGEDGKDGESAPLVSLSGATQAITVSKTGTVTPSSSFQVTGTAVNTTISTWTYSLNGGSFGSVLPTGVTRSGNVVTVNPTTSTFNQLTIKASDGTVSDVFTISRITDGGDGNNGTPGADSYTVFLTNESYTFAGSTSAALAGSTTTEIVVYKGINKITPTSITVGTRPTGLTSSVSGSVVTFTAATSLVTKSGTVPITIVADGKTFTKQFAYALSLQGGKGDPGENGVSVTGTQVQYVQTSSMTEPTSGWVTTRPTPVPGQWLWTRSRNILSNGTYGAWATVPTMIGREALVVSATAPSNPATGTLWQIPTDPNVQKWDGTKWVDWGISVDNLVAENAVIKDGKFETLEGVTIKAGTVDGGKFTSSFQRDTWTGSAQAKKGTIQIEGGYIDLIYDLIQKSDSTVMSKGGYTLDENGFIIYTNDIEGGLLKNTQYLDDGIYMNDWNLRQYGTGKLTFQDLIKKEPSGLLAATGFSQYNTSSTSQNYPTARRIGRIVQLSGAFKNDAAATYGASGVLMGYLPAWAYPSSTVNFVVQGTGMNRFMITVTSNGEIMIERYGTDDYKQATAGSWLNISCLYAAADF